MNMVRLFLSSCLLSVVCTSQLSAEIISWVDENGLRHYSNVGSPDPNATIESSSEYKSAPQSTDTRSVYQQDLKRKHEKLWEAKEKERLEFKHQKQKEFEEREKTMKEREKRIQEQMCLKSKKRLEQLRQTGWENHYSPYGRHNCPHYYDLRQRKDCEKSERRLKKEDYRNALKRAEDSANRSCGQ